MTEEADVAVVGAGPCGLLTAAALGRAGHRVIVVERHARPYSLPRAGHVDAEAVRILQAVDAHHELLDDATPYGPYTWFEGNGDVLFTVDFGGVSDSHWFTDYTVYQPTLEAGLLRSLRHLPTVRIDYGTEIVEIDQDGAGVRLLKIDRSRPGRTSSMPTELRAQYAVAADGANSTVRGKLDIPQIDLGFSERWLIVDAAIRRRWPGEAVGAQYCDWRRPAFETPLGRRHHRWEWQLLTGEAAAHFDRPDTAWKLLAQRNIGPEDVEIVRQQIYTFEAKNAVFWRQGRVLLVGDAAHTMPPFMGQGMCSGLRDVANLAWKLDLLLRGAADEALLDTYQIERRPHVDAWTRISIAAGQISCVTDPQQAAWRDDQLRTGPPPLAQFPHLITGLVSSQQTGGVTGHLLPQAMVSDGETDGLFDDLVGPGFVLLTVDSRSHREGRDRTRPDLPITHHLLLTDRPKAMDRHPCATMFDQAGVYARYFYDHRIAAVLVRPDRYIFGAAGSLAGIGQLLDEFAAAAGTAGLPGGQIARA